MASLAAADAWGFALGRAHVQSAIGEPLRVMVELPALSDEEAETLEVVIAPPEAFQASRLEYKPLLSDLKIAIERGRDGSARLKLQGSRTVNDAYIDLLLHARWKGGQLTRDYTLLLGPAGATAAPAPASSVATTTSASTQMAATPLPPLRPLSSAEKPAVPEAQPRTAHKPLPEQAPPPAAKVVATPALPPAPAPAPAPAPVTSTTATAPMPAAETTPDTATATAPATAADAPVTTAPASPAEPAAAPAPAKEPTPAANTPPAAPESGWLTQSTLLAAAVMLLAGLLVWLRKRQQAQAHANEPLTEPVISAAAAGAGLSVDTSKAQGPVSSMMYSPSQLEASGEIDPIAEADVYLAYGRVQQAEEILRDALRTHPDQASLHLKLLEIAVQRQDSAAGATLMNQLSALTRQQGPDWNVASELASRLRPDQPEAGSANLADQPTAAAIEPAATPPKEPVAPTPPAAEAMQDLPVLDLNPVTDSVPQVRATAPAAEPAPAPAASSQAAAIELDFDLSQSAPEPEAAAALPDLQFAAEPEPAAAATTSAAATATATDMSLDFDLDLATPEAAPAPTSQPAPTPADPAGNGLDFSLDLDQIGNPPGQAPATAAEPARPGEPELMLDFELESENKAAELTDLVVSEDNSASDPLATQLELAQEFLALGDADGARSLAERVLARATGDLQARARALLNQLEAARPQ